MAVTPRAKKGSIKTKRVGNTDAKARGIFDFRILADASINGIIIFQGEIIVYANPAAVEIVGYTIDELKGMKFYEVIHPDFRDNVRKRGLRIMEDEMAKSRIETKVVRKDGMERWIDASSSHIVYDGRPAGMVIAMDITEHKRSEMTLKASESFLNNIFSSFQDGISILDPNLNIIGVNPIVERWYGEGILGKKCYQVYHGRSQPCDLCPSIRAIREKTMQKEIHHDLRGWSEIYSFPMINDKGEVSGVIEHVRDIDERMQAEEELIEAKTQAELYLDLMGHDINNLHQIALGYLELAREKRLEADQREFLDKPIEVLQRSAQLIQNVRKIQKLHDGVLRSELVDVCQLLVDVQKAYGSMPHKQVTLNLNGYEHCTVSANELLYDVFSNLVSNAIKHTGDHADIVVDLDVVRNQGIRYCRVMVEDDGPGIPDDFKGKVFNRMLKGSKTAKGMGLGLYLVKSLVESYGGRVWVEDRVLGDHIKGARFVVLLPAIDH